MSFSLLHDKIIAIKSKTFIIKTSILISSNFLFLRILENTQQMMLSLIIL